MTERRRSRQRLEISREATRLFRERGVAATSGEQIAEGVGLSARTLWRYFRSKESCVEPLLAQSVDAFVATLRRWPAERLLEEHLAEDYRLPADAAPDDAAAVLDIVRMTREEPGLRAVWLVINERAEPVLADVLAGRGGQSADELAVRVQAAALNAALRITTEEAAVAGESDTVEDQLARLSEAVRAATHGLVGNAVA
ncbi:AcrR family transcriptional regulator [Saccharopolyspora lacisalsi]|uniref:AcrR family transcriptional regulator n=1 Tax=Halosaccharopolyspora lacisalsi TaxID=1000566 RepID=A0A839E173_9PSEU|nr:TetR/AcrR family transcriptional regulator [Halosaccharopolyspora lacisalsi]MBA8826266.1 AcrR family transcriptional regulator [Halosaccharopolyspora lacisalsi]